MMMPLQKKYPNREIFYDGEYQIIYSMPKNTKERLESNPKIMKIMIFKND
jgi:hypothetical protein